MNMFEEAGYIRGVMELRGLNQEQAARMLGVSRSYVANKLRLLRFDQKTQAQLIENGLSERHARALLGLEPSLWDEVLSRITERKMSVAEAEAMIDIMKCKSNPRLRGKADRLRCIEAFLSGLEDSMHTLSSIGVTSSRKISYHGSKMMITISIDEG